MIKLMRYNNFQKDPLSKCDCTPPYSAENAISARNDLNPKSGTYPFIMPRFIKVRIEGHQHLHLSDFHKLWTFALEVHKKAIFTQNRQNHFFQKTQNCPIVLTLCSSMSYLKNALYF